ncbi:MAG: outer membrane protein assembly factor BamB [Nitrosomonas sp.]|nr:outer membrane protein assembly factor BamB [Nitrosomonas sp.]
MIGSIRSHRLSSVSLVRSAIIGLMLVMCSGCGSLGIFDGGHFTDIFSKDTDEVEVDEAEMAVLDAAPRAELLWRVTLAESKTAVFYPVYESGGLYVVDEEGLLARLDASTGAKIWQIDTDKHLSGGVGVGEGLILLGTYKGEVLAFDESGNSLWQTQVSSEVLSPPNVDSGTIVVRTGDGRLFGLDATDGSRIWVYQGTTPPLTVRSYAGVSLFPGAVFAGFPGGKLIAMNLQDGNVGWEATVALPRGVTELERMTDISSPPAIDQNSVCAVAYRGRVACFELVSGNPIWSKDSSSNAGLVMDNQRVYVSEERGVVAAYDKSSGVTDWKQGKLGGGKITLPMIARGGRLIIGDDKGYVMVLDRNDGALLARAPTDGSPILSAPEYLPDGFVVQTRKGGVFAFSLP